MLVKITLPVGERTRALRELSDYNISDHSLFQTEDSLVRSLATRVLDLETH